ncbi:hypothetical protein GCM10010987_38540 [Bradyrhizobium guangdongense]|uniref:Uncharacterized protein n=1 Tax=Bradyrhizobium guangdongense TaxID=1325090 RepID=A0AA88B7M2_9BRAD|nr:hypothetical protein GCM10010987_38540 [Bradyrhizobium guangdongense]
MMAALDDVDGVDLHIAEMSGRLRHSLCALPERRARVEPLGAQPDLPGLFRGEWKGFGRAGHCGRQCSGIRARRKKKPRCQLLTARLDGAAEAYFIDMAFCAFI